MWLAYPKDEVRPASNFGVVAFQCLTVTLCFGYLGSLLWSSSLFGRACLGFLKLCAPLGKLIAGGLTALLLVILYLLDFFQPPHVPGRWFVLSTRSEAVNRILCGVLATFLLVTVLCFVETYPWLPLLVTTFSTPVALCQVRLYTKSRSEAFEEELRKQPTCGNLQLLAELLLSREAERRNFYRASMWSLVLAAIGLFVTWCALWTHKQEFMVSGDSAVELGKAFGLSFCMLVIAIAYLIFAWMAYMRLSFGRIYEEQERRRHFLEFKARMILEFELTSTQVEQQQLSRPRPQQQVVSECEGDDVPWMNRSIAHEMRKLNTDVILHQSIAMRQIQRIGKCGLVILIVLLCCFSVAELFLKRYANILAMCKAFVVMVFAAYCGFVYLSFNRAWKDMKATLYVMPFYRNFVSFVHGNWFRALALSVLGVLVPVLFLLSVVNQALRRCRGIEDPSDTEESEFAFWEEDGGTGGTCGTRIMPLPNRGRWKRLLTPRFREHSDDLLKWDWIAILKNVQILCLLIIVLDMFNPITNLVLAIVFKLLVPFPLWALTLSLGMVGLTLFLLPPVPGAPMYLMAGILIPGKCDELWKDSIGDWGFWSGCILAIGLGFVVKIIACAIEQKCFGETLGNYVIVRNFVRANTPIMRAVEKVISAKGLTFGKCVILVGGPDWPTSVVAGILKLSVVECLIGTIPVIFFIIPFSMSGSFVYFSGARGGVWDQVAGLCMMLTGAFSVVIYGLMAWVVQDAYTKHYDELSRPLLKHIDLDWMDFRVAEASKTVFASWSLVSLPVRVLFVIGACCLNVCAWAFTLDCKRLMRDYDLSDRDAGRNFSFYGRADSLFSLDGLLATVGIIFGCSTWYLFSKCCSRALAAKRMLEHERIDATKEEWMSNRLKEIAEWKPNGGCEVEPQARSDSDAESRRGLRRRGAMEAFRSSVPRAWACFGAFPILKLSRRLRRHAEVDAYQEDCSQGSRPSGGGEGGGAPGQQMLARWKLGASLAQPRAETGDMEHQLAADLDAADVELHLAADEAGCFARKRKKHASSDLNCEDFDNGFDDNRKHKKAKRKDKLSPKNLIEDFESVEAPPVGIEEVLLQEVEAATEPSAIVATIEALSIGEWRQMRWMSDEMMLEAIETLTDTAVAASRCTRELCVSTWREVLKEADLSGVEATAAADDEATAPEPAAAVSAAATSAPPLLEAIWLSSEPEELVSE